MGYSLINLTAFALCAFLMMYFIYRPVMEKYTQTLELKFSSLAFPYMFAIYAVCSLVAFFIIGLNDFIEPLTTIRVLVPLAAAALIYAVSLTFSSKMLYLTTAICVGVTVWLQPIGVGNAYPYAPLWVKSAVFVFALIFCLGTRILNILPHIFVLPNLIILLGIAIIALLGGMPMYVAVCAMILTGILASYLRMNYDSVVIDLDDGACVAISYLICSLLLMNLGEFSFPSCVILTMIFWAELLTAIYNRLLVTHIGSLRENTHYFFAAQKYTLQGLTFSVAKLGVVLLFIAWFQLFSVNQYSLMLIAFCMVLWLNGMLGQTEASPATFAEINRKFISDLKQNIKEAKEIINTTKKDKK